MSFEGQLLQSGNYFLHLVIVLHSSVWWRRIRLPIHSLAFPPMSRWRFR